MGCCSRGNDEKAKFWRQLLQTAIAIVITFYAKMFNQVGQKRICRKI
jgi:anti-sigma-K factor RskA